MMLRLRLALLAVVAAALVSAFGATAAAFVPPAIQGHVTDTAGKLSGVERTALDRKLERLNQTTGNELAVFLVASLEGATIEDVAFTTFNAWKLGKKGADNGVLLVIAPSERRVRIETGKGVGGALPDLATNDLIRNRVAPLLKQERFADAIDAGTDAIADALAHGGVSAEASWKLPPAGLLALLLLPLVLLVGLVVFALRAARGRQGRGSSGWRYDRRVDGPGPASSSSHPSGGGDSSGGSGFSGGGGASGGGGSSDGY